MEDNLPTYVLTVDYSAASAKGVKTENLLKNTLVWLMGIAWAFKQIDEVYSWKFELVANRGNSIVFKCSPALLEDIETHLKEYGIVVNTEKSGIPTLDKV
jgi:hypothetical protein